MFEEKNEFNRETLEYFTEQEKKLNSLKDDHNFQYLKINDLDNTLKYIVNKLIEKNEALNNTILDLNNKIQNHKRNTEELKNDLKKNRTLTENKLNESQKLLQVALEEIYLTKNSTTYQVGKEIRNTLKSPLKIFTLPLRLYKLHKRRDFNPKPSQPQILKGKNRVSETSHSNRTIENKQQLIDKSTIDKGASVEEKSPNTNTRVKRKLLFVPTNGAGLGHLTRLLAVATRISKKDPNIEIIFFATSSAMHLIIEAGYIAYHIPPKPFFPDELSSSQWNNMLRRQLRAVVYTHKPDILVFDGAFPYVGLINSIKESTMKSVWIKREQSKVEKIEMRASKEKDFTAVIIPGEAGNSFDETSFNKENFVNPVIYLDIKDLLSREEAANALDLPQEKLVVYIQLGAGNINQINPLIDKVINILQDIDNIHFVIGESVIGQSIDYNQSNIKIIRDYPNSKYFNLFDIAISAAGYNSFHELLYFGVPTIFIPNEKTTSDDQITRAKIGEANNACRVILEKDLEEKLLEIVYYLLNNIDSINNNARKLIKGNGADEIANKILEMVPK